MSSVSVIVTAAVMIAHLISGALNPQQCESWQTWDFYPEHGIWACRAVDYPW